MSDVVQNQELDRFEIVIDGELAGFAAYSLTDDTITFTHTEVLPGAREHGLGGRLVREALARIRDHTDYRVVAQCPFVARFIRDNPEYEELLSR